MLLVGSVNAVCTKHISASMSNINIRLYKEVLLRSLLCMKKPLVKILNCGVYLGMTLSRLLSSKIGILSSNFYYLYYILASSVWQYFMSLFFAHYNL